MNHWSIPGLYTRSIPNIYHPIFLLDHRSPRNGSSSPSFRLRHSWKLLDWKKLELIFWKTDVVNGCKWHCITLGQTNDVEKNKHWKIVLLSLETKTIGVSWNAFLIWPAGYDIFRHGEHASENRIRIIKHGVSSILLLILKHPNHRLWLFNQTLKELETLWNSHNFVCLMTID